MPLDEAKSRPGPVGRQGKNRPLQSHRIPGRTDKAKSRPGRVGRPRNNRPLRSHRISGRIDKAKSRPGRVGRPGNNRRLLSTRISGRTDEAKSRPGRVGRQGEKIVACFPTGSGGALTKRRAVRDGWEGLGKRPLRSHRVRGLSTGRRRNRRITTSMGRAPRPGVARRCGWGHRRGRLERRVSLRSDRSAQRLELHRQRSADRALTERRRARLGSDREL